MDLEHIFGIQVLFLGGITAGYHSLSMDSATLQKYLLLLARFTTCLLASQALELACATIYIAFRIRQLPELQWRPKYKNTVYAFGASVAVLVVNNNLVLELDVVLVLIACTVARYLEAKRRSATITYGEGMACSFSEGYLYQVIPSDGAQFYGLDEQIRTVEASQHVTFPVRRLLIVVTKSLFCAPNLEFYNKTDPSLPCLEVCLSLADVQKDVAGVRDRVYRNTTYKIMVRNLKAYITGVALYAYLRVEKSVKFGEEIRRSPLDPRPLYVVAECATPLHTLWKVLQRRAVYQRLADADGDEITAEFCATLSRIIANSPELRGKCELVYYDDNNPEENLALVLLAKVRELEPNFENNARME